MNSFFLDASALSKRYSLEVGAVLIDHLFNRVARDRLMCLMLGAAEVASVLVRRRNAGRLLPARFIQGMLNLSAEIVNNPNFNALAADNDLIAAAVPLIEQHSINSTDAVVLRLSLDLAAQHRAAGDDLVLVTSDRRLLRAAQHERLVTFDPETQTQADLDALIGP
jgi:predicted nucleic acid-binding protein